MRLNAHWRFPVVAVGSGIIYESAVFAVSSQYPETKPLGFVVGAALAIHTALIDEIRQRLIHGNPPRAVRRIGQFLSAIKDPWEKKVATELVSLIGNTLNAMVEPTHRYRTEASLYRALTEHVRSLQPGEELFAVCADKTWSAGYVKEYLDANLRASGERGVLIRRVFYEFNKNAKEEALRQANHGIAASVVHSSKIRALSDVNQIPQDLGIAIFNNATVYVHRGIGNNTRAFRYDCPHFAGFIRSLFAPVEGLAERVQPTGAHKHRDELS